MVRAASSFNCLNSNKGLEGNATRSSDLTLDKTLQGIIADLEGSATETFERSTTIFFPRDPAEKLYFIKKGAVRLSRIYESGQEITVAFLKENTLFGVSSVFAGSQMDRSCHAVAFTRVEMETAPITSIRKAIEENTSVGLLFLQGLSSRLLQSTNMIETLQNRDVYSRLISFLLLLCKDFGVAGNKGITINLKISQEVIAEAIGSTRVTITRHLGDLKSSGLLVINRQKITIFDPKALAKHFN